MEKNRPQDPYFILSTPFETKPYARELQHETKPRRRVELG